jgi:UDP-N-acetyl-D-galactosamine dehydrogenase
VTAAQHRIAVIGLGYVGLPVAVAFARRFPGTIGFDVDLRKVERLRKKEDPTGAVTPEDLAAADLRITADPADLAPANVYVVAVPTPIDANHRPDLTAMRAAARTVGGALSRGDVVVFESTVYPGVTEEMMGPILAEASGLRCGVDFTLGYSPERINPGDPDHTFEKIVKVVSGQDERTLRILADCYGAVVGAGLHLAPSIRVAEAAKVIENIQRDLNIALVNELSMLFDRLGIDTKAVLEAASSKWNFHAYRPGLVGGHCIGVDPYYLTTKAESIGFHPQVILAGRRINEGMGFHVATRTIRLLAEAGASVRGARIAVLGIAFKPNVPDLRNSRVPDIVRELRELGAEVLVHDPLVEAEEVFHEYAIELLPREDLTALDAVVLAVPHAVLRPLAVELLRGKPSILVDVMWGVDPADLPAGKRYWRL